VLIPFLIIIPNPLILCSFILAKTHADTKKINEVSNDCEGKTSTNKAWIAFDHYSHFTKIVWNDFEQLTTKQQG